MQQQSTRAIEQAIIEHRLPSDFIKTVEQYYQPLAQWLTQRIKNKSPHIVGVQGSQGSGKSTCAHFLKILLEREAQLKVMVVSLDDFYLTQAERQNLAGIVHPLFVTRGVPGTHDVKLIDATFTALRRGESILVPVFDKAIDDRVFNHEWQRLEKATDVLIFEGWCVGVTPQSADELASPINELESEEDQEGVWRGYVNDQLTHEYHHIFNQLDTLIALKAPSFDCVFDWRLLQEQKMIAKLKQENKDVSGAQTPEQIKRFISHYQRLTQHALATLPQQANAVLHINDDHTFSALELSG